MRLIAKIAVLSVVLAALITAPGAQALSVNGATGEISNWGFTPFQNGPYGDWTNTGAAGAESGETSSMTWSEGNNVVGPPAYDFPSEYTEPYSPSPEGDQGEVFDQEFLAWRLINETQIQVLGITSVDPDNGAQFAVGNNVFTYHLGDVFINTDNSSATGYMGYDAALIAGEWTTNLRDVLHPGDALPYDHDGPEIQAGGLYAISGVDDVHGITDIAAFGGDATVEGYSNPFAVRSGAGLIANTGLQTAVVNYDALGVDTSSRNENNTYILEWTLNLADLPGLAADPESDTGYDLSQLSFHWSVECGNDWISTGPREDEPVIPEPATVALLGLGLATMGVVRRRRHH